MKRFTAEILFLNPTDVATAVAALAAVGCKFEIDPDAEPDPCGPTVFGWITGTTELGENELDDWLLAIVDPLGGDVDEWVFGRHPRRPAA